MIHTCPFDSNALAPVTVEHGEAAVCHSCHGIWLPADVIRSLVISLRAGWTGYSTLPASAKPGGACPADEQQMTVFEQYNDVIEQCRECGSIWLPGDALLEAHDLARCRAGNDEPFPSDPDGKMMGHAAVAARIDPGVVDLLLLTSIGVWMEWPWFE